MALLKVNTPASRSGGISLDSVGFTKRSRATEQMTQNIKLIQKLRKLSGAGLMDCKKALEEAKGNLKKAKMILRQRGKEVARKKQSREAREGTIGYYVHTNGKLGCMIKVYCETDFVARNAEFKDLAHDLAMQVLAANAFYLKPDNIPAQELAEQRKLILSDPDLKDKPPKVRAKILDGKLKKYTSEVSLLNQNFFKNPEITIQDLIEEKTLKLGEKIEVGEFVRFEL